MMKPAIKKRWTKALRSGEYAQGDGALRNGDSFCCLGVLCDLAVREQVLEFAESVEEDDGEWSYDGERSYLPASVCAWAGLDDNDPIIEAEGEHLSHMNDNGVSFDEIALCIEEEL